MIEIVGTPGSAEYEAALQLADAMERAWPGISTSEDDIVRIAANTKLSGYRASDIDIAIAARLGRERYVMAKRVFQAHGGKKVAGGRIAVTSFVAAIEVKDHETGRLRIEAGGVSVRYRDGWSSATEQNEQQRYALRDYLKDRTKEDPWTYRCVMLRGIASLPMERGVQVPGSGAVAAGFDMAALLLAMAEVNGVQQVRGEYTISSAPGAVMDRVLEAPLFDRIIPSRLDRARMDMIAARPTLAKELAPLLGERRVHLRGRGGAGKTVLMLQSAHEAFESYGKRSLLLTYNHALAADIQRLLALMGIPSASESGGIEVRTVMSFMYSWFNALGLLELDEQSSDFENYEALCEECLAMLVAGAIDEADIETAKLSVGGQFSYDAILVDEAQDWPQPEVDLLCALYGPSRVSIADGIDQLVRGDVADWSKVQPADPPRLLEPMRECLRMKAGLAMFANAVAKRAGIAWKLEPSREAAGGRVILLDRPYEACQALRERLLKEASDAGNSEVDFLHCVPPSGVEPHGNSRSSKLAKAFKEEGRECWDGVDPSVRRDYPRSASELRVVQYESCRGLEGWVTVLDRVDEAWELKRDEWARAGAEMVDTGLGGSPSQAAWRWLMIALTRPIDTLVISVGNPDSEVARILHGVAGELGDIVEQA